MACDVLSNDRNAAKVPLLQHEVGQGRDTAMCRVSLIIQLIKVYVESVVPGDLGEKLLGTSNLSLVVLFREPRDVGVGDLAGFFGELKEPEGAMMTRMLAGCMKRHWKRLTPRRVSHQANVQATSVFAKHPSCVVLITHNAATLTAGHRSSVIRHAIAGGPVTDDFCGVRE